MAIVAAFDRGATPEEVVQGFPALALASVYDVPTYVVSRRAKLRRNGLTTTTGPNLCPALRSSE